MDMKKWIIVVCMLICMLVSRFGLGSYCTDASHFQKIITSLDEKKDNVLALTGGTTGLSVAITCVPGDVATPIAEKLADLSGVFLVILCAIILEKYMVTITGLIAFQYMLPVAFGLFALNQFLKNPTIGKLATKLLLLGITIFAIVPVSVNISNIIESTYDVSINETVENMNVFSDELIGTDSKEEEQITLEDSENEEKSWWEKAGDTINGVKDSVSNVAEKVENTISKAQSGELVKEAKEQLNRIIEAAAVMLITSCVIPVCIMIAFGWVVRMLLEVDINVSSIGKKMFPNKMK